MPRVKRGVGHLKKRKNLLKKVKGYKWRRSNLLKQAKVAALKAGAYAYRDRRNKKRDLRALWQIRIGAAARENGMSYSKLAGALKKAGVLVDRKILSTIAAQKPKVFTALLN